MNGKPLLNDTFQNYGIGKGLASPGIPGYINGTDEELYETVKCPKCGTETRRGKYCENCGTDLDTPADAETMKHLKFGNGSRDLVIIPGLSFRPVCDAPEPVIEAYSMFADDYTVWLFDRRTSCPEHYTVRQMAADTADEMSRLGIRNADIFGVSQGGMIAQYLAVDHSETVNRLILGSTACRNTESSLSVFKKWNSLAKEGKYDELVSCSLDMMYSKETLRKYRNMMTEAYKDISDSDAARYVIMTQSIIGFDSSAEITGIKCPVLVIGCEGDKIFGPDLSREIADLTGAELYMYGDRYGHCVYDEAPDYKAVIMSFLSRR